MHAVDDYAVDMRRMLRWCGVGIVGGLLACGEFFDPPETTSYEPSSPTTAQSSDPTTNQPSYPTTGSACSGTDDPCDEDADCCDDICLPSGVCGRFPDGEPCGKNEECEGNFCNSMGICGCLAAGVCCEDGPGDCCGTCNPNHTCEADKDCGVSGTYCGIFLGDSCCPGYYCDFSFFGSYCKKSSNPPPEPPDACNDPGTGTETDAASTTNTSTTAETDTTAETGTTTGSGTTTETGTTTQADTETATTADPPPDPVCGDGEIDDAEVCDGQELGDGLCTDFPGFGGGTLACTADCTYDTGGCCKAMKQPCAANSECCAGTTCKFDLLMAKNVCK